MKAKNQIFNSIIAILFAVFIIAGCKKKEEPAPVTTAPTVSPTDSTSQTTRATDQTNTENETNQAMDEGNDALGQVSTTREIQACGYTIDSSQKAIGKIILNYDGTACSGKSRTGSITIQLPYDGTAITRWSVQGAKAVLTFTDYKITYSNGKYLKFNGTIFLTNVNGGGAVELFLFGQQITQKARLNLSINFNSPNAVEWHSAIIRTITMPGVAGTPNRIATVSIAGDTILGGYDKVAMWGKNTVGDNFIIEMPVDRSYDLINPITSCTLKCLAGTFIYHGIANIITLTYGVDMYGIPTTACPYGYKFEWVNNEGVLFKVILPY
jgi:hypothetical protein